MTNAKTPRKRFRRLIRSWAVPAGCGLVFLFLLRFIFFFGYVPSASMEPAIREGSFILGIRMFGEPGRGDVAVFEHESRLLVKRVVGIPGDTVAVGAEVLTVPDGCYFMLGDNGGHSIDSRHWNEPFVERHEIVAIVFARRTKKIPGFVPKSIY